MIKMTVRTQQEFLQAVENSPIRTRSGDLRSTLRMLRGKKYRPARVVIRKLLDWHGRWSEEGAMLLNPWHQWRRRG